MSFKVDISSKAVEQVIDGAKEFLGKLILPAVEETGLLLKDKVTMWKFNNQVKMLNKARAVCEKNGISPKTISLKLLCPLLEYSGLEEDELLQDRWAVLLSNLVDSQQNIENHVFPYVLSQLSSNEFMVIEKIFDEWRERVKTFEAELADFKVLRPKLESELNERIEQIATQIEVLRAQNNSGRTFPETWELGNQKRQLEGELRGLNNNENIINLKINLPATFPPGTLKEFELANIIRLGLAKEEKNFYANSQSLEIPNDRDSHRRYINVDFDIDVETEKEIIITELGELFIIACKEKNLR